MLTLKIISDNKNEIIRRLAKKHFNAEEMIDDVLRKNETRVESQKKEDESRTKLKTLSENVRVLMQSGKRDEAEYLQKVIAEIKVEITQCEIARKESERDIQKILEQIPNLPHESVPNGKGAEDNRIEGGGGMIPTLSTPYNLSHWELAKKYDLIDFELGVKIAGAGFPVYKGMGSRLQRALINFFLDNAHKAGFIEIQPPYLVNAASGFGTGNLPDKDGQMYYANKDDLYLIPTAEVPVTNIYRDAILEEKELPIKNVAYSACFRREAGSYGKDVRGLNRLHQFDKVEIVRIDTPERSYEALEEMTGYVRTLIEKLELPWRILRLCGGDMSFTSALTFDFEVYSAAQKRWLEVSSVSNFESYQANRLKCRYRDDNKKIQLCHTLNGSALALPRIVAALLENNQQENGIQIPDALIPYTGFERIG
ncbi:MAG: serine--tRNA ligase [Tannerellaceae bacterium]|jgi:seryl-tRNA synthetase|nr:serine--tRNA ligase [Tannerellaceae bacterium]